MMTVISLLSSIPSTELPNFDWADLLVKKGGHILGFGLLALAYRRGLRWASPSTPLASGSCALRNTTAAWLLAALYAVTDELHQSFVPGRSATWVDVVVDAVGALLALWIVTHLRSLPAGRKSSSITDD